MNATNAVIPTDPAAVIDTTYHQVVFAVRNQAKAERVAKDIRHRLGDRDGAAAELVLPGGSHGLPTVDFSSPASVR